MTYYINLQNVQRQEFYKTPEQESILPATAIELTDSQHDELWDADQQGLTIILENNQLIAVHPDSLLTPEELAERKQNEISSQAKVILNSSSDFGGDWQMTADKFAQYTKDQQKIIIDYREALREVIRGNSQTLPEVPQLNSTGVT